FKEVTTIEIDAVETYGNSSRGAYIYRTFKVYVRKMACYYTTRLLLQLCSGLFSIPLPVRLALVLKGNGVDVTKHCVLAVPTKRLVIFSRKLQLWGCLDVINAGHAIVAALMSVLSVYAKVFKEVYFDYIFT
nr:2-oxoglutarate (2OG) and Fe(II)-dependent oxygenase superfamily protein [Tanacetum cinerariifolium]